MGEIPNELIMRMWTLTQTLSILRNLNDPKLKEIEDLVIDTMRIEYKRWEDKRKQ